MKPIVKSYCLLQINLSTELGLEEIEKAYQKKLAEIAEIKRRGYTPLYNLPLIESAMEVLIDYYRYAAYRN